METYRLYGLRVSSDMIFPQLVREADCGACGSAQSSGGKTEDAACEAGSDGQKAEAADCGADIEICAGKIPEELLARAEKRYEFGREYSWLTNRTCWIVAEKGRRLTYQLKEGGRQEYLRSYLLGWGMSMLALQRNTLAIHCSTVADKNGAVLICGESGAGKSTLTAALLDRGFRLMADDMTFVSCVPGAGAAASPAFPYQKLCRDAALAKGYRLEELLYIDEEKDKFLVPYRGAFSTKPVAVRGLLVLGVTSRDGVEVSGIDGVRKLYAAADNLFLRHLLGKRRYEPWIGQLCLELAAAVPMAYLARPAEGDTAGQVTEKALQLIEGWREKPEA